MDTLKQLLSRWLGTLFRVLFLRPRPAPEMRPLPAQIPPLGQHQAGPGPDPQVQAWETIFAPRIGEEEQVHFDPVNENGMVVDHSEETFRENGGLRTLTKKHFVVDCSGRVVPATDIRARCSICQGFTSEFVRCIVCGVPVCPLCQQRLEVKEKDVFCPEHIKKVNTWKLWDASRKECS